MYITYYLKYGRVRPNQIGDPKSVTDFNLELSSFYLPGLDQSGDRC